MYTKFRKFAYEIPLFTEFRDLRHSHKPLFCIPFKSWHETCNTSFEICSYGGIGRRHWKKDFIMHNRNFPYGLVLAGALAVLFSLMYVTSVAVANVPAGL